MNYQDTVQYLFDQVPMFQNLGAGAYKPGLDTTLALAARWGNPQNSIRHTIHVGGTNGKGSTSHTLAAILQSAGYKVGLYTSPHLVDFRERIRVNGEKIPQQYVVDFVKQYMNEPELQRLHPTFFELTTIMALRYFADEDVDVAVIEVGLGGRLDCTNIITPCLSIITNISFDHTALLGHTLKEIATEKAGIIKHGVPVVIGNAPQGSDVREVFNNKAARENAPIVFACDNPVKVEYRDGRKFYSTKYATIAPQLTADCQAENAAAILHALDFLTPIFDKVTPANVVEGFEKVCDLTGLMGRWMQVESSPNRIICDTGHNIGGWQHLSKDLAAIPNLHMIIGFVNDKDVNAIMETMPRNATYYFATPSVKRGRPAEETARIAAAHGIEGTPYPSVAEALAAARKNSGDTIFIGGSTFIVADFLSTTA